MKSLRLFIEFKTVIGRHFLSCHMLVSFQPIDRIYFYHHIQAFFLHTVHWNNLVKRRKIFLVSVFSSANVPNCFPYAEFFFSLFFSTFNSGVVGWAGYSSAEGHRFESYSLHYLPLKMSGTLAGKNPKMFRPVAVRNRLTTPFGRKSFMKLKTVLYKKTILSWNR